MRPVRAKALIINAFALTGRFAIFNLYTQGAAWAMCFLGFQPVELSFDTPYYIINPYSATSLTGMALYRFVLFPDEPDTNR